MQDKTQLIARYQQLRQVGMNVASTLVKQLSKEDMDAGAEKLGILKRGIMVFNNENERISEGIASLIRMCLEEGRASNVAYEDVRRPSKPMMLPAFAGTSPGRSRKPPPGVDVYDPCPCGSGKKFKFCCGARR